jgi:nucleolar protein 58
MCYRIILNPSVSALAVGFCLFSLTNSSASSLKSPDLYKHFSTPSSASALVKLHAIHRFTSAAEAVKDASEIGEGKVSKSLKKFLQAEVSGKSKGKEEQLVVVDPKLGEQTSLPS